MPKPPLEDKEQIALIKWARRHANEYNGLKWLYAITNENSEGPAKGAYRKAMGVNAGVSDLCLPYPKEPYYGLYIEMKKRKGGRASAKQKEFKVYCSLVGYKCVICKGAAEAKQAILDYYNGALK